MIDVRIVFPFNILRTNSWILMKFCVFSIVTSTWNFMNFSTELWPLIDIKISIFRNNEWSLIKFCLCIDIINIYSVISFRFKK